MRNLILAFASLLFFNCSDAQIIENVDAIKFKSLIENGDGIILDVRTPNEVSNGHIKGCTSINISDKSFSEKVNLLQKDKPIYIYCLSGSRSLSAANYMSKIGFKKIYNLVGGLLSWNKNGFPLEKNIEKNVLSSNVVTKDSLDRIIVNNKLVLIDFYAVWCAPCRKMFPDIDKLIGENKELLEVVKIDIEVNSDLAKLNNIISVPTLILYKNGKVVWSFNGAKTYDELIAIINNYK